MAPISQPDPAPSIPSGFRKILEDILIKDLLDHIRDFLNNLLPGLTAWAEAELNKKIKAAEAGRDFLGFKVVEATSDNITVLKEMSEIPIPGLPTVKLSNVTIAFTIQRSVNLTNKSEPTFKIVNLPYYYTLGATFKRDNYMISLAGGENVRADIEFNQYRAEIRWDNPAFYLRALWASSNKGGFLLDAECVAPFAIPLGPSGLGLMGIGLLYGERFAPNFDGITNASNAVQKLEKATAKDYVNWSKAKDLDKWIAINSQLQVFGISTTIVEMATGGNLLKLVRAGISYVSFGPTINLGGSAVVLNTINVIDVVGSIDIRSQTVFLRAIENVDVIPGAVAFDGSFEISASLKDTNQNWIAIGGYDMNGCRVTILEFLKLEGGARLVPFQGAAARAMARVEGKGELLGVGGGFDFWIIIQGNLGWNPIEIGGSLEVGGNVWVKIIGLKIGLGIRAKIALQIYKPLMLNFAVEVEIDLPWPLPSINVPIQIFKYEQKIPLPPLAPVSIEEGPLSYIHSFSGNIGQLELDQTKNIVWPDVMFVVPMQRIAGNSNIILNRTIRDGDIEEAGISVRHQFGELKIEKIDTHTGLAVPLPDIRASWLFAPNGASSERSSRLAIPCVDPLNWINRFDYAQPNTSQMVERMILQTFGKGPSESVSGHPAQKRFESVVIKSGQLFWVQAIPWSDGYERGILAETVHVEFSIKSSGVRIPVKYCDIRIVQLSGEPPSLYVTGGKLEKAIRVRELGDLYQEWSYIISREKSDYANDLHIGNGEQPMHIVAIGYLNDMLDDIETPPQTVFTPGNYVLTITGVSRSSYKGTPALSNTHWTPIIRRFTVINPPLRPYLRYSTIGDERIFGLEFGGWNPNPKGMGFGHYPDHLGLVRAGVNYLSKIYPVLWISPQDAMDAFEVKIVPCAEGTRTGIKASQQWAESIGLAPAKEEELVFDVPQSPGLKTIRVFYTQPESGSLESMIDEWTYRVSLHRNPIEHLRPKASGLKNVYGPFGQRLATAGLPQPTIPAGFDMDILPNAELKNGWALPQFVQAVSGLENPHAGLHFLQCLDWAGIFEADPAMAAEGVLSRPAETDINLVFEAASSPIGLLLRTNEPCDWRRTEFKLARGTAGNYVAYFDISLIPSPDGCNCILIACCHGVNVRLPKGDYILRGRFMLSKAGLPRLTNSQDQAKTVEEFYFTFNQPYGKGW